MMVRMDIHCPFCLKDLRKWKIISAKLEWATIHRRQYLVESSSKMEETTTLFEHRVLEEHRSTCPLQITQEALDIYGLER